MNNNKQFKRSGLLMASCLTTLSLVSVPSHADVSGGPTAPKRLTSVPSAIASAVNYCASSGGGNYEYIANVQVANLANASSGTTPYTDFTGLTANLVTGSNAITLTPGFVNNSYTEYWTVFVDFNQDGDFTDEGENVYSGSGNSAVTGAINVPANAVSGNTRMRISMKYGNAPFNSCENFASGEVEDYTVNIQGGGNQAPTAATTGPYSGTVGSAVAMSSAGSTDSDGSISTWSWDFGDGNTSSAQNPSHSYASAGNFTVSLTVTDNDGASSSVSTTANITDGNTNPSNYCSVTGGGTYEWIAGVQVADLNNTSTQSNYADYTSQVATLAKGANSITLTPGFSGNSYTEHWGVWIDFNKDGDFADAGEQVVSGLSGNSVVTGSINVPQDASGTTRMRVGMKYNQAVTDPCTNVSSGEFEDYTVKFDGTVVDPDPDPNPSTLPDVCATQEPTTATTLEDGVPVCMPATSGTLGYGISLWLRNDVSSIAFTTKHGKGNLTMRARAGDQPSAGDNSIESKHVGNTECLVLTNLDTNGSGWNYVQLTGLFKEASIVADFNATSCRETVGEPDPGATNNGWNYNNVNVVIYPMNFSDTQLEWTDAEINAEMEKVKQYYTEQSYGNFNVTWQIQPRLTIPHPMSKYNDKTLFNPDARTTIEATGADFDFPDEATLIMMTVPRYGPAGNLANSVGGPSNFLIVHYNGSTIAHEMGHAFGLHHARGVDGGSQVLSDTATVDDYGNVFDLMGMGGYDYEEYNLMYKSFFQGWLKDTDVPFVTTSGTQRIYAFDHGSAAGTNTAGQIGIRLKSDDESLTYWIEYRTSAHGEDDSAPEHKLRTPLLRNGILVNVQGFKEEENPGLWWNHISKLLDFTPNSRSSSWALEDYNDAPLQIGNSWTDPSGKFRITPTAKGGTENTASAWIDVNVEILK